MSMRGKKDRFTFVSLFAGCGGSSLGYEEAGGRELLAVEWDRAAAAAFRANFPGVPVFEGDVARLSGRECLRLAGLRPGELDVLDGSPPCQGFSTAGKRDVGDPRNGLFREYARLLRALKPKAFVMENVSGLIKGKMRIVFSEIMRELKASGYEVRCKLLDAMWWGVPQSRRRLIFVGVRNDLRRAPVFPRPFSNVVSVAEAIGDLLDSKQNPAIGHVWIDESPAERNTKTWPLAKNARQGERYAGHHRRDSWHKPASTITTVGLSNMPPYLRSMNCHPLKTRVYSILECKRLCSFPDAFVFPGEWFRGMKQMGNAVPPAFMKAVAEALHDGVLSKLVLPDRRHGPAGRLERGDGEAVPSGIAGDLRAPKTGVRHRKAEMPRAAVPKAAVHEDGDLPGLRPEIGAEPDARMGPQVEAAQEPAREELRRRVPRLDGAHDPRPDGFRDGVHGEKMRGKRLKVNGRKGMA